MHKILLGGDLHKRMKDITTIHGYCNAVRKVQMDIMKIIEDEQVDTFISLGDWFDSGYGSDVSAALSHTELDMLMAEKLNGRFYGLIGNHIRVRMDSNPELFLIQPHPKYVSRHECNRQEQVIKTPNELFIEGVQISLNHFNPQADNAVGYCSIRRNDAKFHIGLYHSEHVIPANMLAGLNMFTTSTTGMIEHCMKGVDLAFVGHIHKPLGSCQIQHSDGSTTTLTVPGSLVNTDAGLGSRHEYIDMPLIIIDEGTVTVKYIRQTTYSDECEFYIKNTEDVLKLKPLHGNNKENLYDEISSIAFGGELDTPMTLGSFMNEKQYTRFDKKMVRTVIDAPEDIATLITLYKASQESNTEV